MPRSDKPEPSLACEPDGSLDAAIVGKIYEYQFTLIHRRWYVLLAYIAASGFLIGELAELVAKATTPKKADAEVVAALLISGTGIVLAIACTQIVDLLSRRLREKQDQLRGHGATLIVCMTAKPAKWPPGVTWWVLVSILMLSIPFVFATFWAGGVFIGIGATVVWAVNACLLTWEC